MVPFAARASLVAAMSMLCASEARSETSAKVLRIVPHSNLAILDPIWTPAYIARNHAYMIYDTLFGTDANGRVSPQMVDEYEVSADGKTWTFRLRHGLEFHDGAPVTSDDVVCSIRRWGQRDVSGIRLLSIVQALDAVDARTFRMQLKEPYGLVLESLGKPGSNAPVIMPARVAMTPASKQIEETIGSGPFLFKKDEWKPGEKVVYVKNTKYVPRTEPASGTAGGKVARVDRVEWIIIKDPQTQANALLAGEIDLIEQPAPESYASFKGNPGIRLVDVNRLGLQPLLRFNHVQPPFNDVKVRQAAMAALNQPAFLNAQVGIPELYRTCFSIYACDTPLFTTSGMDFLARPDIGRARQLLKVSGYDGTPVVLMQATDVASVTKLAMVAAQLLRQAGFKVDLQSMDWQTLVSRRAKKDPPSRGGWNAFLTNVGLYERVDPISDGWLGASCDKAFPGWPCDEQLEALRDAYARAPGDRERKALAEQLQVRAMQVGVYVPLGEVRFPAAVRKNVKGLLSGYFLTAWNVEVE